ncbi:hypothetical protein BO86DRAFT_135304 [Aspergillus japonicus CBS 114.51]|uniref:Uncharacterized protein n=2 Tax=Aspergillus TaxID=5052 RepID=A0A2V5H7T1_ASPV1|nr:hypothetical protein BO86DRAFT_135304 [Aspergillus japonicus CBS 114.51]PYI20365.1 hypothetical protein BO99DRAFT_411847 [Aspergillus violaceofuscus CBS 115571]RAH79989.1 hypothetical protein BO86DRAFT_135304 [Aspergillus japonicus CBS 114.51]
MCHIRETIEVLPGGIRRIERKVKRCPRSWIRLCRETTQTSIERDCRGVSVNMNMRGLDDLHGMPRPLTRRRSGSFKFRFPFLRRQPDSSEDEPKRTQPPRRPRGRPSPVVVDPPRRPKPRLVSPMRPMTSHRSTPSRSPPAIRFAAPRQSGRALREEPMPRGRPRPATPSPVGLPSRPPKRKRLTQVLKQIFVTQPRQPTSPIAMDPQVVHRPNPAHNHRLTRAIKQVFRPRSRSQPARLTVEVETRQPRAEAARVISPRAVPPIPPRRTRPPRPRSPVTEREPIRKTRSPVTEREPIRKTRSTPGMPHLRTTSPQQSSRSITPTRHVHFAENLEQVPPSSSENSPVEDTTTGESSDDSPTRRIPTRPPPSRIPIRPMNRRSRSLDTHSIRSRMSPREPARPRTASPYPTRLDSRARPPPTTPRSHTLQQARPRIIQEGTRDLRERGSRLLETSFARRSDEAVRSAGPTRRRARPRTRVSMNDYWAMFPGDERIADEDDRSGGSRLGRWR